MLHGLDLFSGIGGLTIALKDWVLPVAFCEIDPYCQSVLLSRGITGDLPKAPIWDDIKSLDGSQFKELVDVVYAGFPCQGISVAGLGRGLEDERSGLFYEIVRLCSEIKPRFIFLENVPAITTRGGTTVVREITKLGYDCRWCVISAASVGALHRRERWFLLAHAIDNGTSASADRGSPEKEHVQKFNEHEKDIGQIERASSISEHVSDTERQGWEEKQKLFFFGNEATQPELTPTSDLEFKNFESVEEWRRVVSTMDKCSNGFPCHVDALRSLGNSVVPRQAKEAFKILMGLL